MRKKEVDLFDLYIEDPEKADRILSARSCVLLQPQGIDQRLKSVRTLMLVTQQGMNRDRWDEFVVRPNSGPDRAGYRPVGSAREDQR